jgi:hypothetical protein
MCTHPKAVQPLPLTEPAPAFDRVTSHFPGRITLPSLCSMGCAATGSVVRWPSSPYHGTRACRNTPPRSKHRKTQTWFSEPREVVYLGDSTCPAGLVREGWIHGVNRVGAKQRPRSKLGQHLGERQMQPHYQCCHGTARHGTRAKVVTAATSRVGAAGSRKRALAPTPLQWLLVADSDPHAR